MTLATVSRDEEIGGCFVRVETHSRERPSLSIVRDVLAEIGGWPPESITFDRSAQGKLRVVAPRQGIGFSIAHCRHLTLVGVAPRDIGVDIECLREVPEAVAIVRQQFDDGQAAAVASTESPSQTFLRMWTRIEALAKATGAGLPAMLEALPEPPEEGEHSGLPDERERSERSWSVRNISVAPGHIAAVAVELR